MSTNFYFTPKDDETCPHCGRSDREPLHIGKRTSGGFIIHVDDGVIYGKEIASLREWADAFSKGGRIFDERGYFR